MKNNIVLLVCLLSLICCKTESSERGKKDLKTLTAIKAGNLIFEDGTTQLISSVNDSKITTIFLVRHAEKEKEGEDPELTEEGKKRAEKLARLMKGVPLKIVGTTKYKRVLNTVGPTATEQAAPFITYTPQTIKAFLNNLAEQQKGHNILIGGHSNTVPVCLNLLTNSNRYTEIPREEYGKFYVVQLKEMGEAEVLEIKY